VLEDSRIAAILPAGNDPEADARAAGADFIDASGLTVMPGLWDAHIHPRVLDFTAKWWGVTLAYGITTGLSNGGTPYHTTEIREAIESGNLLGPRLIPSPLFDGQRPYYGHHRSVHDAEALALELGKAKALGMQFYKVYVRAPISYMQETARFASALGLPSGSHFLSPGIQSGITAATHLSASQRMGYSWAESAQGKSYQDVMTLFTQGDFNLSSHHTSRSNILGDDPGILDDPRFRTLMPVNYHAQIIREASTAPTQAQWQAVRESLVTPAAIAAGGGLVTIGSDTPLSWPALALHAQLRAYAAVVGNHAALQAVTLNAARYAKVERDLGSIEVGKIADMLVVRGNPLEDVRHAADIELIIKNGVGITVDEILARYR
jgi:imidazolonepropionase-like amidohydrolase